ncbi:hypothetical protein BC832DRAFT_541588 [Gaertneriomyces semiglobifer]|nr:hypothetical protein BC832DRAFT_541588 [Gaertneriomyces semiglobifer]
MPVKVERVTPHGVLSKRNIHGDDNDTKKQLSSTTTTGNAVQHHTSQDKKDYLSGNDNLFLLLEDPFHTMNVVGIYYLSSVLTADRLRDHLAGFARDFGRTTKKLADPQDGTFASLVDRPYFVDCDFNVDDHFTVLDLGNQDVQDVASSLISRHLPRNKPLWHAYYIRTNTNSNVLIYVAHHALADGQGFVKAMLAYAISDGGRIPAQYNAGNHIQKPQPKHTSFKTRAKHYGAYILAVLYGLYIYISTYAFFFASMLVRPRTSLRHTSPTAKKQVAWSTAIPLSAIKHIKNHYSVTVNDVLTTCVSEALHRFISEHADISGKVDKTFWMLIPTSMRRPTDFRPSNQTSGYITPLPNHAALQTSLIARLRATHATLTTKKSSPEAKLNYIPQPLLYRFPALFLTTCAWIMNRFTGELHGVMTNVPGPAERIQMCGVDIERAVACIPLAGVQGGVSWSVLSYDGEVGVSVIMDEVETDETAFAPGRAKRIVKIFESVVDELRECVEREELEREREEKEKAVLEPVDADTQ